MAGRNKPNRKTIDEVIERTRRREQQKYNRQRRVVSPVNNFYLVFPTAILLTLACLFASVWVGKEALITAAADYGSVGDAETGDLPTVSTVTDATGEPIAQIYDQYRLPVKHSEISQSMLDAIVAIEDKRFYEHGGVDIQGTVAAALSNAKGGSTRGASTLEQQYAKNYRWLVAAQTDEERQAAIAQTLERKLKDIQTALKINQEMTKEDSITMYLNVVPFGHNTFGVDAASRVYFGIPASKLNPAQAAMLAGMVQSPEYNNPYSQPENSKNRRDTVLQVMRDQGKISQKEYAEYVNTPLGVLEDPQKPPTGCITAGDKGYFCDYVMEYLAAHGIDPQMVARDGYTITTTLDPEVQANTLRAVQNYTNPQADNVQTLANFIKPGDGRELLAMVSSRNWGLDVSQQETSLNTNTLNVGDGAGSTFKVFTAAEYLRQGGNITDKLSTPETAVVHGMGSSDTAGCPSGAWCVKNAGSYPSSMTLQDALAQSPNTTFAELIGELGVQNVVDTAVKLGLRSYAAPRKDKPSMRDELVSANQGAFTLGFTPVQELEMSNVAATLASGGRWCEPNPVAKVTDRNGKNVPIKRSDCEEALPVDVADKLNQGLGKDVASGTAAGSAKSAGWDSPVSAKTGTTEIHRSSSFLGYTNHFAGFVYTFSDGATPVELCSSPLRACPGGGDLYGGLEPAKTWFDAVMPMRDKFGKSGLAQGLVQ